jgi:hypothetical protein
MAKDAHEPITWILLRDAKALVADIYQAEALTEKLLVEWLEAGQVRWRCLDEMESARRAEFWQAKRTNGRQTIDMLVIDWDESWARRRGTTPFNGHTAYRIQVSREDILKALPTLPADEPAPPKKNKKWQLERVKTVARETLTADQLEQLPMNKLLVKLEAGLKRHKLITSESTQRRALKALRRDQPG